MQDKFVEELKQTLRQKNNKNQSDKDDVNSDNFIKNSNSNQNSNSQLPPKDNQKEKDKLKDPNLRDYDKEPIVIKSYERFISINLYIFSHFFTCMIIAIILEALDKYPAENFSIILSTLFVISMFTGILFSYYFYTIRHKYETHLTNSAIKFYRGGVLKRVSAPTNSKELISKPFWRKAWTGDKGDIIFYAIILIGIIYIARWYAVFYIFSIYILNITFKIVLLFAIKKNLKDFSFFPILIVDKPKYPNRFLISETYVLLGQYYFLYIFDKQQYQEIKTYFLDMKNINIDYVKKYYFI